jgi:RNA polymerase sigma-70 factor (ECF subfamily)
MFPETRWTLVNLAGQIWSPDTESALGNLCVAYRDSLVAFAERLGHKTEDAEDLTQSFLYKLLRKGVLGILNPQRGKFRSYLCSSFKNFIASVWAHETRVKRGGRNKQMLSIEEVISGNQPQPQSEQESPERLFDRHWARLIFKKAYALLRKEYQSAGKSRVFKALKPLLTQPTHPRLRTQIAANLRVKITSLDVLLFRLRSRFRSICRDLIQATVSDKAEMEEEFAYLKSFREELQF